jgi:thymidylate kinase
MLITFSGLDGAGKSTLVRWLQQTLERQNRRVVVFHMNDHVGVYAYLRRLRNQLGGAPPKNGGTGALRRVRDAVLWGRLLRRVIYPLDLLLFLGYRLYHESIHRRVVIMDRYFYDILVDVSSERSRRWIRWLKRITPTPTLPLLLDTGPEQAFARKGEYSLAYRRDRWTAYGEVFPWVRGGVRLRNDDPGAARAALRQLVSWRMGGAETPNPAPLSQP